MTKKIKQWWKRIKFWNKTRLIIATLGVGGETTILVGDYWAGWHVVAVVATLIGLYITILIEDDNNNGIADIFE